MIDITLFIVIVLDSKIGEKKAFCTYTSQILCYYKEKCHESRALKEKGKEGKPNKKSYGHY